MFHQNLSKAVGPLPTNQTPIAGELHKEDASPRSSTETKYTKASDCSDHEDLSPIRHSQLLRLTMISPTPDENREVAHSNKREMSNLLGELQSPLPSKTQPSISQVLAETRIDSFDHLLTPSANHDSLGPLEDKFNATGSLSDKLLEADTMDAIDETRSDVTDESAQLLEARAETFTRLRPTPLQRGAPHLSTLSPIAEASHETSIISENSTTLVEIPHPLHRSPTSTNSQTISPYIEDIESSQWTSESPCERIPFAHFDPSLLGAIPTRPSPLQQFITATEASLRVLDLENFELPEPPVPTRQNSLASDLSVPLQVPLDHIPTSEAVSAGQVNAGDLLIAINAYIAHSTRAGGEQFVQQAQQLFEALGMSTGSSVRNSISSDPTASSTGGPPTPKDGEAFPTTPEPKVLLPTEVSSLDSAEPEITPAQSEPISPATARPFASLSRQAILNKLAQNNEDLREMIMSWHDRDSDEETPSFSSPEDFSPPAASTPMMQQGSRFTSRVDRLRASQSPSPSVSSTVRGKAGSRLSLNGNRRFSDHTFASLNRSLQTVETELPKTTQKVQKINAGLVEVTPNIIAPTPRASPASRVPKSSIQPEQENTIPIRPAIPRRMRPSLGLALQDQSPNQLIKSNASNVKVQPPNQKSRLPAMSTKHSLQSPEQIQPYPQAEKDSLLAATLSHAARIHDLVSARARQLGLDREVEKFPMLDREVGKLPMLERETSSLLLLRFGEWSAHINAVENEMMEKLGKKAMELEIPKKATGKKVTISAKVEEIEERRKSKLRVSAMLEEEIARLKEEVKREEDAAQAFHGGKATNSTSAE